MKHKFQCLSCDGVYFDSCDDGLVYFHACGPRTKGKDGAVAELADARDENLAATKPGRPLTIKAEGRGVKCLSDARLSEPAWITKLKERAALAEGQE
jgi:hypothetical protein